MLNIPQCTFGVKSIFEGLKPARRQDNPPNQRFIHSLTLCSRCGGAAVWRQLKKKKQPYSSRGQFATLGNKTALACHFDKSPVLEYQELARNVKQIPSGELRCAVPLFNRTLWQCWIKVQRCKSAFFLWLFIPEIKSSLACHYFMMVVFQEDPSRKMHLNGY